MTFEEYRRWASEHCTTFGLFDPREAQMVLSWFDAFDGAGYILADLTAATEAMRHPGPAPQFRSDHLRLIQIHASASAKSRAKTAERSESNGGPSLCSSCAGSGWIAVPHPAGLSDGRMVRGITVAVSCSCARGCTLAASELRPTTLAGYELFNPDWRNQLDRWHAGQAAAVQANGRAKTLDKDAGPLVRRLAATFAPPKEQTR